MTDSRDDSKNHSYNSVLVTGGCGFIGSNFVLDWLGNEDAPVVNLDALTYAGNPENLASVVDDPRYTFVHGDICDAELLEIWNLLDESGISTSSPLSNTGVRMSGEAAHVHFVDDGS